MPNYIVIEIQNGNVGEHAWAYDTRDDAEVKFYQVLAEVVKSPIETHTVMLMTDEGFVIDSKCYKHGAHVTTDKSTGGAVAYDGESV